ncbi:hypothetical protein Tco_0469535 [Tanacetum coccineum]
MVEYSQKWHNGTSRTRSTETSDVLVAIQAQLNNLGREIKKVNEKVYVAQVGCEQCKGPHYTKDCPLKEEGKTLEEAYYTQFGGPFQGGGYRAAALGFYQRNNANPSYQERRQSMEETLSKFMSESAKRHEENSNMIKEIRASTDAAVRNQGASIKTLEIQIGKISKVLQERGFGSLPSSTEANPRDHVKSISTIVETDSNPIRHIGSPQYAKSTLQNRRLMFESRQTTIAFLSRLNDYYCEEKRDRMDRASVSVMPLSTYLNLGLGKLAHTKLTVELADRTMKYPKGIAENMLVVVENMDGYRDQDMGDIILGVPFCKASCVEARRFDGLITIHNDLAPKEQESNDSMSAADPAPKEQETHDMGLGKKIRRINAWTSQENVYVQFPIRRILLNYIRPRTPRNLPLYAVLTSLNTALVSLVGLVGDDTPRADTTGPRCTTRVSDMLESDRIVHGWLKEQQDRIETMAQQQAAVFQAQFKALWADLQSTLG